MNEDGLTNEEVYKQICKCISSEYIRGVQRIGGLWRLYITDYAATCKLLTEGIDIRGKNITIHENNPFLRTARNTVLVRVCDVPLSVHGGVNAEIIGECMKEKLRVGGQLVNCFTGNRRVEIKIPSTPLPRYLAINDFKAKIFHPGQPQTKDVVCSHCLEKGHYAATCRNPRRCTFCKNEGHTYETCPQSVGVPTAVSLQANKEPPTQESVLVNNQGDVRNQPQPEVANAVQKPKAQSYLKLKSGKIEITKNPFSPLTTHAKSKRQIDKIPEEDNQTDNTDDSDSDEHKESSADSTSTNDSASEVTQYSSLSAVSPSPNQNKNCGAKRKQKGKKKRKARSKSSQANAAS